MAEKTYINGIYIREKTFTDGGSVLNVSLDADKMIAFLNEHRDDKGYVNVTIGKRREPSEGGITHSIWLDTWKPNQTRTSPPPQNRSEDGDNVPF